MNASATGHVNLVFLCSRQMIVNLQYSCMKYCTIPIFQSWAEFKIPDFISCSSKRDQIKCLNFMQPFNSFFKTVFIIILLIYCRWWRITTEIEMESSHYIQALSSWFWISVWPIELNQEFTWILHDFFNLFMPLLQISVLLPSSTLVSNVLAMNVNKLV